MSHVGIRGISIHWPEGRLDATTLVESGQMGKKSFAKIGVQSVPIAALDQKPSELAIKATADLLEKYNVNPDEIDIVIYVGSTPHDYLIWSPSAKVMNALGIGNAFGFEIWLGCGGIQVALHTLKTMMMSSPDWKKGLVVSAENWGPFTNNRAGAGLIFGDAGAAALVEKGDDVPYRLAGFDAITDGTYSGLTMVTGVTPYGQKMLQDYPSLEESRYTIIDGDVIPQLNEDNTLNYLRMAESALAKCGWSRSDITYTILPSSRIDLMNGLLKLFELDPATTNVEYLANQGDLGSTSVLVELHNAMQNANLEKGDKVLALSAGVGITWLATAFEV